MGKLVDNSEFHVADFETTVFTGQKYTEVWLAACVQMYTEDVKIMGSINEFMNYIFGLKKKVVVYFHNLKFDGEFILNYLKSNSKFIEAYSPGVGWQPKKSWSNNMYSYSISQRGQWYTIRIKKNNVFIEFRDSLKLLPFSVKQLGESFGTKHKKLDMEYTGFRYAGCPISPDEKKYASNDVLVVKEALEIMHNDGHNALTIGSCCMKEFKSYFNKSDYETLFPNIYDIELDKNVYGFSSAGYYVHASYRGGWCYLVPGKANKVLGRGTTADVNSLYPSMMHSESGNYYPVGEPTFWKGNYIPKEALTQGDNHRYYFVRFKCRFKIKPGMLPFVQIKGNLLYRGTENLTDSRFTIKGKKYWQAIDSRGEFIDSKVTMTMTCTDYELFLKHYDTEDLEILDGVYFYAVTGIFDEYIDKYRKIKETSKGAKRTEAKLFSNNLYGKMASSTDSSYKLAYEHEDGGLHYIIVPEDDKKPGYIPIGSAITSYARRFTITAAQANYHGEDQPGFVYADTDSIHCDLEPEEIVGIKVHDTHYNSWKLESCWDFGIFVRQKTYIEHVVMENLKPCNEYLNIKCAGMPDKCKILFEIALSDITKEEVIAIHNGDTTVRPNMDEDKRKLIVKANEEELEFLKKKKTISDFKVGLSVPGKLRPVHMRGGIVLMDTPYTMRSIA